MQSYRPGTPNPQADSASVGVDSGLASTAVGSDSVSMGSAPSVSTVGCSASGLSLVGAIELVGETDRDWCTGREAAWGMLTRTETIRVSPSFYMKLTIQHPIADAAQCRGNAGDGRREKGNDGEHERLDRRSNTHFSGLGMAVPTVF